MMRASGILMPIFSLDSPYGIGTFGEEACRFVDFLKKAGQRYWQILPLNPTHYGDSPYQSFSAAAGNPYFIDLRLLEADGLLFREEYDAVDFGTDDNRVDYEKLKQNRFPVLRKAFSRFSGGEAYLQFCAEQAEWLPDYALFMALKNKSGGLDWKKWPADIRRRDPDALSEAQKQLAEDIAFYQFIQFEFYRQWAALKRYANDNGILIIGDMPIYVADDSVDVWAHADQFDLDEDGFPRVVAGCPPDIFSKDGQLWGMPVYSWEKMRAEPEPYSWWRWRIRHALSLYDMTRIDHFRGFESFYCVPYGAKNAQKGTWRKGPGEDLFRCLQQEDRRPLPIIAEDLGFLTPGVKQLLQKTGFPGMKILQFAFNSETDNDYLPHRHERNCVVYTGTHDNDTVAGWVEHTNAEEVALARRYLHVDDVEGFSWAMIRAALMSVADTAIIMMPDLMGLGSEARINTPATVGGNWQWRIGHGCVNDWLAGLVRENTELYGRIPTLPTDDAPAVSEEAISE